MLHLYNIKHTGMKTRSLFIGMLLLLVLMGACNSGSVMTQATGFAYEVVVVMDQKDWKGPAGEAIKSELASSRAFFEDYLRTTKGFYRSVTVCKEYISGYDRPHRLYESFCRLRE